MDDLGCRHRGPEAVPVKGLGRVHDRRLRVMYRSAGWPCCDAIEIDLLAAGLLERVMPSDRPEYLRLTPSGIQRLSGSLLQNREALDAHETLVARVAALQLEQGRIAWRGLTLLGKPGDAWQHLRPDVFSIRTTTVEDYVEPLVFEIKVKRADLLADLRKPEKRGGYLAIAAGCYYVLAEGIATPEEIPPECGVMVAHADRIEKCRPAPQRAMRLDFQTWMALARQDRVRGEIEPAPWL